MDIQFVKADWDVIECDAFIAPLFQDELPGNGLAAIVDQKLGGLLSELKETGEYKGKIGEIAILYRPSPLKMGRLILAGAGKRDEFDACATRSLALQVMRRIKGHGFKKVAFYQRSASDAPLSAQAIIEGISLATYGGDDYKTVEKSKTLVEKVLLISSETLDIPKVEQAMARGEILARATNLARELTNEPGNRINPTLLAEKAQGVAEKYGLAIEVLDESMMQKKEMNTLLAVARGSDEPARLIVLKHLGAPDPEQRPVVLIGKGVTFDSGGLSLKPAQSMEEMKADKAGACTVLGAMQAVAELKAERNVIGIIAAVENLPSGRALRPGDVIRSMSGKNVEIINTDAEGRLILADALHYARQLQPEYIVDLATLTGACVVALGHVRAGLFCNNEELYQRFMRAAEAAGEKFWRLPLDEEYRKEIKSEIADIKNAGSRWAGAISAAKFLQEFVADSPWCHVDMAGVDLFQGGEEGKSPTGFGVRTLATLVCE